MRTIVTSLSSVLLLALLAGGCGGKDGSEVNGGNGNANSTGASGPGFVLGGGASSSGGVGNLGLGTVIPPDAACATGTASAALSGVNMFVMFDRSSSMNDEANDNGDTRWEMASSALTAFFSDPNAAGLELALRFFPHDKPSDGCNQDGCDVGACAMPLVQLGTLTADPAPADAHEKALLDATAMSAPGMAGQGTPISAALGGALQWAAAQRTKTPTQNSVVVLVTDGQANGCDTDIDTISQLAADALMDNQVRTYAIGLTGSREDDMDQIAQAGGTEQGIFVADGAMAQQQLIAALGKIRGEVLDCDFPVPEPKPGLAIDPAAINVNYTAGSGMKSTLNQVTGADACASSQGWYYDNPSDPSRIILCKSTCDIITADAMAGLEILLGCATVSEVPK